MATGLAIIADDFTGANDTGVQFSKRGLKTGVVTDRKAIATALGELDVVVVDTETRFAGVDEAYARVRDAARILKANGIDYIYKKIDSTFRGNIGAEITAALDAMGAKWAFIAPALPSHGRTTLKGKQLVYGKPVAETEMAQDPKNPVSHSYIPDIIALQTEKKSLVIPLSAIRKGKEHLAGKLTNLREEGWELLVFDSETNEDLQIIAQTINHFAQKLVLVGSAGLAEQLPEALGLVADTDTPGAVIIIAGSVNDTTRKQVDYALREGWARSIDLDIGKVLGAEDKGELQAVIKRVSELAGDKKGIIIRTAKNKGAVAAAQAVGEKMGLGKYEVSERIAGFLGQVTRAICDSISVKGLMLTGGDTAIKVAAALSAAGTIIGDEVLPGIPWGNFISDEYGDIRVVTKAGGFGGEDSIAKIIDFLKGH